MSSEHDDLVLSDLHPNSSSTAADGADEPPPTMRLGAFELAFAVASMEFATDEDERPASHDEPTIEVLAPRIPPGVPSPLGDDEDERTSVTATTFFDLDLGLDLDLEADFPCCVEPVRRFARA
jgi:hypothetical protein